MRICQLLEVFYVALNSERGSVCAPDAYLRITVSSNLEDGLSECLRGLHSTTSIAENTFPDVYLGSEEAQVSILKKYCLRMELALTLT